MEILKLLYENMPDFNEHKFTPRKVLINGGKILLYGAPNSGKSMIAKAFLSSLDKNNFLYINLSDIRINSQICAELPKFLAQNKQISSLVIDGICADTPNLAEICMLNLENIILITQDSEFLVPNFKRIHILPLDFEEFIAFDKRSDENALFATFLQKGNSPSAHNRVDINLLEQQNLIKNLDKNGISTLLECAKFAGKTFSVNQIYYALHAKNKISKNSVYSYIGDFTKREIIIRVKHFSQNSYKIYFSNFIHKDALGFEKDFLAKLRGAVFCELRKLQDEIYYTKQLDFYLPNLRLGIIVEPFRANEFIFLKFNKMLNILRNLGINRLQIITAANYGVIENGDLKCEILPFQRFALRF